MARGKRTGRHVETRRGYVVRHWTASDPADTIAQPYTVSPLHGFGTLTEVETLDAALAAIEHLPPLRMVRVEFEAYVPVAATPDQVDAWVSFELHENGSLSGANPLGRHELSAFNVNVTRDEEVTR